MKKISSMLLIVVMLFLTACGGGSKGSSGSDDGPIKLGALFPLTGDLALLGEESYRGAELAVEEINANGGINGREVELVKGDAVDPDAAQAEANRLINQENIQSIVGSYSSGIAFAASEVAERNGALYWELGAVADNVTDREYQSILRTNPPASMFSVVHINFIKDVVAAELGKDLSDIKVAIAHEDSSYGTTIADEAEKLAEAEGINVVSIQPYSSTSNDLTSVILNIKKADPDVLIVVSYINDAILISRQMKELNVEVPVFIGSGGGHTMTDFADAVGENSEHILNVDFPQYEINKDATPGMEEFLAAYEEKFGSEPRSGHSLANYMGMKVVLEIIEEADGELDPEKLREVAMNYKVEKNTTATGWGVEFDEVSGQNKLSEPYITQWIDGELITVYPEEVAIEKPKITK
ncbi:ABC transporter substrate-binding protein [Pseudogracilibacillus sp. SE30717A]|uniref:ABC transporter substrate-binding protein n=1 Tax=Pseudogracilibacillus sp. SE30717A TaxID=3098293 RepID=UPI00300E1B72